MIPPRDFYNDSTRLGLPEKVINGKYDPPNNLFGNFRLRPEGTEQAKSYKTVLRTLLNGGTPVAVPPGSPVPVLNVSPITRVMVDSFNRGKGTDGKYYGTPNPLDTALPFIIDTVTDAPGKPSRQLAIDMVARDPTETADKMAWNHSNVTQRLKPLPSDTGSVLIVSTVQGLWTSSKAKPTPPYEPDSITGNLITQYALDPTYLGANKWRPVPNASLGSFGKVSPQKGTTIYVYGELNNNPGDGNEVYVYSQNASNQTFTFLGGLKT